MKFGGNQLTYNVNLSSPTIRLLNLRIHLNSVISDDHKGNCYITADIVNYYLNNLMSNFQYMWFHLRDIPHEVIFE